MFVQLNSDSRLAKYRPIGYIVQEDGCWVWVGCKNPQGYGKVRPDSHDGQQMAHRWMYERDVELIPEGKEIHHTCNNTSCVNPGHLEIVTRQEHVNRDSGLQHYYNDKRTKPFCVRGHARTEGNIRVLGTGFRSCKKCEKIRARAYHLQRR